MTSKESLSEKCHHNLEAVTTGRWSSALKARHSPTETSYQQAGTIKKQTDLQKSAVRLCRHRILSPTERPDTSPLSVQWRLEEIQRWISGTSWPNLETGAGPADHHLPRAHRALWSECTSEEDWHFRHFSVWMWTSWPNPRPRPSVLPRVCWEMSANMATGCWSDDQAVGLGRRPLLDGWFCGINRTEDLSCTAADRWRRRRRRSKGFWSFKLSPLTPGR